MERGVEALTGPWEYVAIHDGARPLVTEEVLGSRVPGRHGPWGRHRRRAQQGHLQAGG